MSDYEKIRDCYGKEHDKRTECETCKYADYCKDAIDLRCEWSLLPLSRELVDFMQVHEIDHQKDPVDIGPLLDLLADPSKVIGVLPTLYELSRLAVVHPSTVPVVIGRIMHPDMSERQLARKLGMSKTNVHYHLKQAGRLCKRIDLRSAA